MFEGFLFVIIDAVEDLHVQYLEQRSVELADVLVSPTQV